MSSVFKYKRQAFSPTGRFVVRKKLLVGDKEMLPGDAFPWRKLGFKVHRLKTLFETGYLEIREDGKSS